MSGANTGTTGWSLTLPCNRAEAEALPETGDIFADLAAPPTLLVDEPDPDQPDAWVLTAYFDHEPDAALVTRVRALAPSAGSHSLEPLPDADWTTMSQRGLEPVRAGRFIVHTSAHVDAVRAGDRAIAIEAGLAFGTGQHATTHGCLWAIDALARARDFRNIADLGTGTGILAMAAAKRWPGARVIASDNDPICITVTRANLRDNAVREGRGGGRIALVEAAGMAHTALTGGAPYDLIIANILAGPLVGMARPVAAALAPGGVLVLAGLLHAQATRVAAAYRRHGLVPVTGLRLPRPAEWPCLVLRRL